MVSKRKQEKQIKNNNFFEIEENLLNKQDKKLKKHYLKSDAKAFIHKFIKMFRWGKKMYFTHLIVIILVVLVFIFVVQHFSSKYIYYKLHNKGASKEVAKNISQEVGILMAILYGALIFILLVVAICIFEGGTIVW